MAHTSVEPVTGFAESALPPRNKLERIYQDSARYWGVSPFVRGTDGGYDLSGLKAFIKPAGELEPADWPVLSGWSKLFQRPFIVLTVQNRDTPSSITATWRLRYLPAFTWSGIFGSSTPLPNTDNEYHLSHARYSRLVYYGPSTPVPAHDGLAALPCLDEAGNFYFFFGWYRIASAATLRADTIGVVGDSTTRIVLYGILDGDGGSAGASIPRH